MKMNKVKVKIIEDELYPFYCVKGLNYYVTGHEYEISIKLIDEYKLAEKQFMKVRDKLRTAMEKNSNVKSS